MPIGMTLALPWGRELKDALRPTIKSWSISSGTRQRNGML
jgi:hypothetical protein